VSFHKVEISLKNSLKAPSHLRADTQAWWTSVCSDYDLDAHHVMLLTLAAESWDRCCEAREILSEFGCVIGGREGGARPHPAVAIERDAKISFARLIAQLNLDAEMPVDINARAAQRSTRPGGWRGQAA